MTKATFEINHLIRGLLPVSEAFIHDYHSGVWWQAETAPEWTWHALLKHQSPPTATYLLQKSILPNPSLAVPLNGDPVFKDRKVTLGLFSFKPPQALRKQASSKAQEYKEAWVEYQVKKVTEDFTGKGALKISILEGTQICINKVPFSVGEERYLATNKPKTLKWKAFYVHGIDSYSICVWRPEAGGCFLQQDSPPSFMRLSLNLQLLSSRN